MQNATTSFADEERHPGTSSGRFPSGYITLKRNKKLSYCRDSASRQSLPRSRSFKVTDSRTNRKPICDILLLTSYLASSARYCACIALFMGGGCLSRTNSFYRHKSYIAKTRSWTTFCRRDCRSTFNHFYVTGPKAAEFGRITQNNGHYIVQGHSRSPVLVPI